MGLRIPIQVWLRIYLLLGELALDLLDDKVLVGVRLHENEGGLEAHGCRLRIFSGHAVFGRAARAPS